MEFFILQVGFQLVVVNEELVAKGNLENVSLFTTSTSIIIDFNFILLVLTRSALFNSTALLIFHNILKTFTQIILPGLSTTCSMSSAHKTP